MHDQSFPHETAEIRLTDGYPRIGSLTEYRDDEMALYYFPGDFIAGDGFEVWLTAAQAKSSEAILEELTIDDA